jgi:hypothetical protein
MRAAVGTASVEPLPQHDDTGQTPLEDLRAGIEAARDEPAIDLADGAAPMSGLTLRQELRKCRSS